MVVALLLAPSVQAQSSVPRGRVAEQVLFDSTYHRARRIWVYTPPGYAATRAPAYPMLVAFDGADYRDTMPLPSVLDSLLASRRAPAFVAVLVDDSSSAVRLADLANQPRFASFLGDQLLPWVRQRYNVTRDPHRVIVTGSSAGGLGAAYVAFARPELFGNVLSQSGAFWRGAAGANGAPYEWLTAQVSAVPRKDVRFLLDVGALETHEVMGGSGPVFIDANRRLRDALRKKGYSVVYAEVPGGRHAPEFWRARLAVDIETLASTWDH